MSVRVTTFETLDEAFSKLSPAGSKFDVIFSAPDQLSRLVGRQLIQPLNFELVPNLKNKVWPELHSPFYDLGPRYSVPYTVYTTGIGWRNDKLDFDPSKLESPGTRSGRRQVPRARRHPRRHREAPAWR